MTNQFAVDSLYAELSVLIIRSTDRYVSRAFAELHREVRILAYRGPQTTAYRQYVTQLRIFHLLDEARTARPPKTGEFFTTPRCPFLASIFVQTFYYTVLPDSLCDRISAVARSIPITASPSDPFVAK